MTSKRICKAYNNYPYQENRDIQVPWVGDLCKTRGRSATLVFGVMWAIQNRHRKAYRCNLCHVTILDLMEYTGMAKSTVCMATRELEASGLITVVSGGPGRNMSYAVRDLELTGGEWFWVDICLLEIMKLMDAVVWSYIRWRASARRHVCDAYISNIAGSIGVSVRPVKYSIASLVRSGMVYKLGRSRWGAIQYRPYDGLVPIILDTTRAEDVLSIVKAHRYGCGVVQEACNVVEQYERRWSAQV